MQKIFLAIVPLIFTFKAMSQANQPFPDELKEQMKQKVIDACRHSWNGYKQYAWGFDDLQPLTKNGRNWHKNSLLMTPVDAYDTFVMLEMHQEADESKDLILSRLNFNLDDQVQVFEIVIRLLGGLISAYELDADKKFLTLAEDLAKRLLPAFNTPTGMPYRYVHLQTGAVRDSINNPAEIGTLMMEFGKLSHHTGNPIYYNVAKKAIMEVYNRRSKINLVGLQIDVNTGAWKNKNSAIGAYIDSYYEYLFKCWKLFGDKDFKKPWKVHQKAIKKYLISKEEKGWFLRQVDMNTGKETGADYGALDAFYAGLCAYAGDIKTAKNNQQANYYMWTRFNIEPEVFNFRADTIKHKQYILRPENIESCFYLYRFTKDDQYLWMGKRMIDDIIEHCKTEAGYASLRNVLTYEKTNSMQSFFLAETLKYAYLLFASEDKADFDKIVFNTEAHPFTIGK